MIEPIVISIAKFNLNKHKYQALLADHRVDGREPPVVRGPQVENRCRTVYGSIYACSLAELVSRIWDNSGIWKLRVGVARRIKCGGGRSTWIRGMGMAAKILWVWMMTYETAKFATWMGTCSEICGNTSYRGERLTLCGWPWKKWAFSKLMMSLTSYQFGHLSIIGGLCVWRCVMGYPRYYSLQKKHESG